MSRKAINKLVDLALNKLKEEYPTVPEYAIPKPKYTDRTSNGLTKCVIDWINFNGYFAERINSMGRQLDQRKTTIDILGRTRIVGSVKWIKGASHVGTSDIAAIINGRSVKIEVKCEATGDKYQSKGQKLYQKKIQQAGGVYVIARTFEGFLMWYNNFIQTRS